MKSFLIINRMVLYLPKRKKSHFFVSTPIYYVNASPHIGHLHSSVLADAYYRFQILLGLERGVFSTGTDEHGTKIQHAAKAAGRSLPLYCNEVSEQYKILFDKCGIGYTDFVRTTSKKHKNNVQRFWNILVNKGFVTKGVYSGWYCDADEAFLTEAQVTTVKTGNRSNAVISLDSGRPVHWVEEENYEFDLSKCKVNVQNWVNSGTIRPKKFQDLCNLWLEEGIMENSLSISRPKKRVHWSIEVPDDPGQTIYVWLDALINYLTVGENHWPPDCHVIGKDILKFHGIYWPAFLAAAGYNMPKRLFVHSHWMVNGEKMSKSKGNIVDPFNCLEKFGASGIRYFLLREGTPHSDSNYSEQKIVRILNSELADTLGNLLSRTMGSTVNAKQHFPPFIKKDYDEFCLRFATDLINAFDSLKDSVASNYEDMNFYKGITDIISALHQANRFVEMSRPWELRKDETASPHLKCVLHLALESLRISGIALLPIVPDLAGKLLDKLNIPNENRLWVDMAPSWTKPEVSIGSQLSEDKLILFKRICA